MLGQGLTRAIVAELCPRPNDVSQLVDTLTIFCVHDADAAGTMIYQTFQEETKARGDFVEQGHCSTGGSGERLDIGRLREVASGRRRCRVWRGISFRSPAFITRESVEACVVAGVIERAPEPGITYTAFVDPSGGSADSMTAAVSHYDAGRATAIVDAVREFVPPLAVPARCRALAPIGYCGTSL